MSPLLYQLSYTARKDGTEPGEMIQECSGECLARIIHDGSSRNGGVSRDKREERDSREL